jgi:threonylcarbamoyladenosine tRNA methylthiotransferase CDKAL1
MASADPACVEPSFLDDIEDLVVTEEDVPVTRMERSEVGTSHESRKRRRKRQEAKEPKPVEEIEYPEVQEATFTNIPGVAKVFVKTWGCAHNNSDGEYMAGLLSEYGYDVVIEDADAKDAHVWVLNSCTVKGPAEAHFVTSILEAQKSGKRVIVAGCVPQAWGSSKSGKDAERRANAQDLSVIGVQQIDRVVEVVEETLAGNTVRLMGTKFAPKDANSTSGKSKVKLGGAQLSLPKIRRNPLVEIVPISTGCLNACTYCKTKHARGHLGSYSIEEIVDRIKQVVAEGVLEIWLTSEDTGAYGIDIGTDITQLLWRILEVLPEPVMLRMGMTNPPYIKRHAEEMAKIYHHPRIYSYLHMPIQSASDAVLEAMKREYSRRDFEEIVDQLKSAVPNLNVATDLIVGFPEETDEDYRHTWDLVQKYQFSVLFINQFYPRPGTPAAKMKRVNTQHVKERTRELSAWFKNFMPYDGRVGEIHSILVTEMAPDGIRVAGRTKAYEMVLVDSDIPLDRLMGRVVEVKITETGKFFLKGAPTENGISQLDSQVLPRESVLHRAARVPKPRAESSSSGDAIKKPERLDYHEGDDGEDYEEEDLDACGDEDGTCGSHGDSVCGLSACGDAGCGDCGSGPASPTATNSIEIGPSDRIAISKPSRATDSANDHLASVAFKAASSTSAEGLSTTQKLFAILIVLFALLLMNYPWLKKLL